MKTDNSHSLKNEPKRSRGRPRGSTDHPEDVKLLKSAARLVNTRHASSPTDAFRRLAGEDEKTIRRLQRKWKQVGNDYLRSDQHSLDSRWDYDLQQLRRAQPSFYVRAVRFAATPAGKARLQERSGLSGKPAHPMSLGLMMLFQLMDEEEHNGGKYGTLRVSPDLYVVDPPDPGDRSMFTAMRFQRAIDGWIDGGHELSSGSMRELARRCKELADDLENDPRITETTDDQRG